MNIENLSLDLLIESAWNPNVMDERSFNRLCEELKENGFIDPIQVVPIEDGKYQILGGHHRFKAAKLLSITDPAFKIVPCVVLSEEKWQNEDLRKFVNLRLNVLHGKINPEKFVGLYKELIGKYGDDSLKQLMGFTSSDAWVKLVGSVRDSLKKGGASPEAIEKFDDKNKKIKNVNQLADVLKGLFQQSSDTLSSGFMVLTFGNQENLYIKLNESLKDKMWHIKDVCYDNKVVLSDVIDQLIDVDGAMRVIEGMKSKVKEVGSQSNES